MWSKYVSERQYWGACGYNAVQVIAEDLKLKYAAFMVRGKIQQVKKAEIDKAKKAGWTVETIKPAQESTGEEITPPPEKVVDSQIAGIDFLELEDAVQVLWKQKVFASSGMGCTGPVILVAGEDRDQALEILKSNGYL